MYTYFENMIKDFLKSSKSKIKFEFKISSYRLAFTNLDNFDKIVLRNNVKICHFNIVLDTSTYNNIIIIEVEK